MNYLNAMTLCDFYKLSHRTMYPERTELVYATWTPRTSRISGVVEVVNFGIQAFIKDKLINLFNELFFNKPKKDVVNEYKRIVKYTLNDANPFTKHMEDLHDLGYLPLSISALPEGCVIPVRTPVMTIHNTHPNFFWLTNYIETLASCELWQSSTSATIAHEYKKILTKAAIETVGNDDFVKFQGHDFSMRGMSSLCSSVSSGMGHLLSFVGTDTIPAIQGAEYFYSANIEKELVGTSIPATEHSIQCSYNDDMIYLEKMVSKIHPNGFVSIVSDGYDFWDVVGRVIPELKDKIMARDGKVVIRPDSGDPVKIICGDNDAIYGSLEHKGAIESLWDIFGGALTEKGYKLLDSHIGLIYGDAITLDRAKEIVSRLKDKGFASINVVFGIGSYTYQYNTRDTFGYALKTTLSIIDGEEMQIFKNPKTDNGIKKSQKGKVAVLKDENKYRFIDGLNCKDMVDGDQLIEVFRDGKLIVDYSFSEIRERLNSNFSV